MDNKPKQFQESVASFVKKDFVKLNRGLTVGSALEQVKKSELSSEGVLYFYVVDDDDRLVGVLPTRRLLTAQNTERIDALAVPNVAAITLHATVWEACEMFLRHKYLAFPVVDDEWRLVGMVDISLFAEEIVDLTERRKADAIFEILGFRVSQLKNVSAVAAWRFRFPWLLSTMTSGVLCAVLASAFERTLARSIVLTFFLTLVLALGESVSIQSMTMTIQRLRFARPTLGWYLRGVAADISAAALLAVSCGVIVGAIVGIWRGSAAASVAVGASILFSQIFASVLGLSVPSLLHALKLDPKVAAGPLTLALTDLSTLAIYFAMGNAVLR